MHLPYFSTYTRDGDKTVSPWHDIALEAGDGMYNLLTEIPKMTKAKMEVATKEASNPIAQDIKKGKLRGMSPLVYLIVCVWLHVSVCAVCACNEDPSKVVMGIEWSARAHNWAWVGGIVHLFWDCP